MKVFVHAVFVDAGESDDIASVVCCYYCRVHVCLNESDYKIVKINIESATVYFC